MSGWKKLVIAIGIVAACAVAIGAVLVYRGFRATARPSRFEAAVARGMRNLAIPRRERREKNPLAADAEALSDARNVYLARCALCHGVDGSGRTPVGQSLYPRVPDLRSPKTQNLSDGEIHYIIENGVQLTGMPAWGNAHREMDDDSWKLVLFIRSLRPLSKAETEQQAQAGATAHYTGSQSCAKCHQDIYDRWKKTPMANIVRDPREHPDAIIPNLATNNVHKFSREEVAFVYGSIWKQRYFTKVGDDYFPLPVQWEIGKRAWSKYFVPNKGDWWAKFYPPDNMKRPTGPTCDGCHSVDYNIHTKQVAEWNVGCERCHGPGSEHVAHPTRGNILNPAHMDEVAASDTCIQCHSQGRPLTSPIEGKYYDWPVGYHAGLKLADYWKLEEWTPGQTDFYYFADGTAHKNRMQGNDFVQSVMYRRGITCSTCHDAHGTSNYAQLREPADKLCLECHGPLSPNGPREATIEGHTHHKAGSKGSECVACHMPAMESEGVPGAFVHAHTFKFISPAATLKYGEPNPCTLCHTDKKPEWALDQMRSWQSTSPWRVLRLQ
ncbi:MAG TPA: cytochrome c3 family protein [Candidatus Acidoferrales bacterium]|nr:cytochrome c3 family protein [Candidatus Acidoferrales bacterium]